MSILQTRLTTGRSPALIPKPKDWPSHISISGFFFLPLAQSFTPDPELAAFLEAGDPPVYIGFGSIVVDDPNAMTSFIFDAVKKTGRRALVSKGWGGLGASEIGIPEGVYMVGNVPHDWLFQRVACVVHHGGAGTTAAGIAAGKPTVVIPFFGDQPFWGAMTARAGAGPQPVPYKSLTVDKLADAILEALKPQSLAQAQELSNKIRAERGDQIGAQSFHQMLKVDELRCLVAPKRAAAWRVKRTQVKLSAVAATVLAQEGEINFSELKLYVVRQSCGCISHKQAPLSGIRDRRGAVGSAHWRRDGHYGNFGHDDDGGGRSSHRNTQKAQHPSGQQEEQAGPAFARHRIKQSRFARSGSNTCIRDEQFHVLACGSQFRGIANRDDSALVRPVSQAELVVGNGQRSNSFAQRTCQLHGTSDAGVDPGFALAFEISQSCGQLSHLQLHF